MAKKGRARASLHQTLIWQAADGPIAQGKVVGTSVEAWETAAKLAPSDPLPQHLLGSFAFVTSQLSWVAQAKAGLRGGQG